MRLKIVGTGHGWDTKVIVMETGEQLQGLLAVEWRASGKGSIARITLADVPVELETERFLIDGAPSRLEVVP